MPQRAASGRPPRSAPQPVDRRDTSSLLGNRFSGEIAPQLRKLIDSGTVRLLDLVFITKDEQDEIGVLEYEDHDDVALFAALDGDVGGFINDEDVAYAAAGLEPGSSAALLVWDDLWATELAEALRTSGAVILESGRVPHELVQAAEDQLAEAG